MKIYPSKLFTSTMIFLLIFSLDTVSGAESTAVLSCDIQHRSCTQTTDDKLRIEFDIQPKPVKSMSDLIFTVILTKSGVPVDNASIKLNLSMPGMYMGENTPVMQYESKGRYTGKGLITKCMSGKKTWQAEIMVTNKGKQETVTFIFEVQ